MPYLKFQALSREVGLSIEVGLFYYQTLITFNRCKLCLPQKNQYSLRRHILYICIYEYTKIYSNGISKFGTYSLTVVCWFWFFLKFKLICKLFDFNTITTSSGTLKSLEFWGKRQRYPSCPTIQTEFIQI